MHKLTRNVHVYVYSFHWTHSSLCDIKKILITVKLPIRVFKCEQVWGIFWLLKKYVGVFPGFCLTNFSLGVVWSWLPLKWNWSLPGLGLYLIQGVESNTVFIVAQINVLIQRVVCTRLKYWNNLNQKQRGTLTPPTMIANCEHLLLRKFKGIFWISSRHLINNLMSIHQRWQVLCCFQLKSF
jgi:hypothetical protein